MSVAAAASMGLLCGCAPSHSSSQLTEAEFDLYRAHVDGRLWRMAGLADVLRPQTDRTDVGLLTSAQLDYLYDYYQHTLVPCLGRHGITVRDIPSRAEAVDARVYGAYPWNPYGSLDDFSVMDPDDIALWLACPAFP